MKKVIGYLSFILLMHMAIGFLYGAFLTTKNLDYIAGNEPLSVFQLNCFAFMISLPIALCALFYERWKHVDGLSRMAIVFGTLFSISLIAIYRL